MLDAARDTGPKGKEVTSSDYIFLMLFEGRQISLASWSVAAAVVYVEITRRTNMSRRWSSPE